MLNHDQERSLAINCPHCQAYSHITPVSVPSYSELVASRPSQVGVVYRCDSCNAPIFLRFAVKMYGANRIELSNNFVELERAREKFNFTYLPEASEKMFREALACYSGGHFNAFASMCRRTAQAVFNDLGESGRLKIFDQITEARVMAEIDLETFNTTKKVLFGTDADAWPSFPEMFAEALEATRAGGVFTTHTPVPAGFDVFTSPLMDEHFGRYAHELGISSAELLALGRAPGAVEGAGFNMAALALRTSAFANGVSRLHGEVSRRILGGYFPGVPEAEVPVGHVTDGAHTRSCVSRDMAGLFDRYLGPDWFRRPGQAETWEGVDAIPDEELWATHDRRRERLVVFARRRLARQLEQRGAATRDVERAKGVLNTRALTIGFARRFATYKRAGLILQDLDRLREILLDAERPVQIIFAGKAHPAYREGKEMLKAVVGLCQKDEFRRHAVFIEDYDLVVARYLVQGVDVWLNTPRRGMEASGTSGMKVVPNGGLNLSILDGWWVEGYLPEAGWAIGKGEEYEDHTYQDAVESSALHDLLESDVVPLFYSRGADGLPRAWIQRMKRSMRILSPAFSTNRMLWEYAERYYEPAARCYHKLAADGMARAKPLAAFKASLRAGGGGVRVESGEAAQTGVHRVGERFALAAIVRLGAIEPDHVTVEAYFGPLYAAREIREGHAVALALEGSPQPGVYRFTGTIPCERSGMQGYGVRVRPSHPDACDLGSRASFARTWRPAGRATSSTPPARPWSSATSTGSWWWAG